MQRLARDLIAQYGARAVRVVVERTNKAIDDHEHPVFDFWAEVVICPRRTANAFFLVKLFEQIAQLLLDLAI